MVITWGSNSVNYNLFTGNLYQAAGATMFFIIEEAKETILDFSLGTVKVLWMCSIILLF